MIIISPKWIYSKNNKLDTDKSLLIDEAIIADILDENQIKKKYNKVERICYPNHILMPSFTESFLSMNDCHNKEIIEMKINKIILNGITKIQIFTKDYNNILKFNLNCNANISYIIPLDGKRCSQRDIKELINILDYYKSDPTKQFGINLINILEFNEEVLEKISSIANEVNMNIHIEGNDLNKIINKNNITEIVSFWESINLLNNIYMHNMLRENKKWLQMINKKNITLIISYKEIDNIDSINIFINLLEKKYKCILVSDDNESFSFYKIIKILEFLNEEKTISFDQKKLINCITLNSVALFNKYSNSGSIDIGNQASFNLFDYTINKFISVDDVKPKLSDIDNQSLSHVWSVGKQVLNNHE